MWKPSVYYDENDENHDNVENESNGDDSENEFLEENCGSDDAVQINVGLNTIGLSNIDNNPYEELMVEENLEHFEILIQKMLSDMQINFEESDSLMEMESEEERMLSMKIDEVFSKIAEDNSGEITEGDEFWDVESLMARSLDKRSLNKCKNDKRKERLILLLDTSGSCLKYSEFFSKICFNSYKFGDIEIYEAPNGVIEKRFINPNLRLEVTKRLNMFESEPKFSYNMVPNNKRWVFSNRKIVFFGDNDGIAVVSNSSYHNKIYWFNCENRGLHDVHTLDFAINNSKAIVFPCTNEMEFLENAKKIK